MKLKAYPKDRKKSQMFFSAKVFLTDIAETLRSNDPVKICAEKLRNECEQFDFLLEGSFNDADDIKLSFDHYNQNRPNSWELFFNSLFPYRSKSDNIKRKCDSVFQIIYNVVHNGYKKTTMHISLYEAIHKILD